MESLDNKVVVVTGGSKGFGKAIAINLKAQGAKLALIARNEKDLLKVQEELGKDKVSIHAIDITKSEMVNKAFEEINYLHGSIDHFVNNAGLAKVSPGEALKDEDIAVQINTNLLGKIFCVRAAIPYLKNSVKKGSNSRIINISSATAHHTDEMSHMSVYAATKAALERFSRELRTELEVDGIGVSIVRPGAVMDTDFASNLDFDLLKPAIDTWHDRGPYCYHGMDSSHVADAVQFCLSMPRGVSVDLLEIRPNLRMDKPRF